MPTLEEQLLAMQTMAATQQKQLEEANEFARKQQEFLNESQRQLQQSQQTVASLTTAFQNMATTMETNQNHQPPRPQRKKPELPPFDPANIQIWIRRVNAAYSRAGIDTAKDKFAYLGSISPGQMTLAFFSLFNKHLGQEPMGLFHRLRPKSPSYVVIG